METTHNTPPYIPQIRLYQNWLRDARGLLFDSYDALWRWSTTELDAFWQSVWDYFRIESPTPHTAVLGKNTMPGAQWFPGAQVNYARQALRHVDAAHAAGLGVNAGHDLTQDNLTPFIAAMPFVAEVSIGHAFVSDALEIGYAQAVRAYKASIERAYA